MSKPTKYKSRRWLNMKLRKFVFGIDARIDGQWYSVCEDDKPLMYDSQQKATKVVRELNKQITNDERGTNKG